MPSQNTGMATPDRAMNIAVTSNAEYGITAEMTPVSMPTSPR